MGIAGPYALRDSLGAKDFTFLSETDPALNFEPAPAAAPRIHCSCGEVMLEPEVLAACSESSHFRSLGTPNNSKYVKYESASTLQ